MPFARLKRLLAVHSRKPLGAPGQLPISHLAWAVRAASRRVPAATCLTQSMALHCLMARAGYAAQVHIGVSKDAQSGFKAHAWVEYEGRLLLSGPAEVVPYTCLHSIGNNPL